MATSFEHKAAKHGMPYNVQPLRPQDVGVLLGKIDGPGSLNHQVNQESPSMLQPNQKGHLCFRLHHAFLRVLVGAFGPSPLREGRPPAAGPAAGRGPPCVRPGGRGIALAVADFRRGSGWVGYLLGYPGRRAPFHFHNERVQASMLP